MKLYLVSGAHEDVPDIQSSAHLTAASADAEALRLVNIIRANAPRDGMDSDEQTPSLEPLPDGADWRAGLREAQRCIVSFNKRIELTGPARVTDNHSRLVRSSRANVRIVALDVKDATPLPDALETLIAEAEKVADLLENALPVHIYDEDEPADNVFRAALAALAEAIVIAKAAGIWQGEPAFPALLSEETLRAIQAGEIVPESQPCREQSARTDFLPGDALGRGSNERLIERWQKEYLAAPGEHWGDKIEWGTARAIAALLDAHARDTNRRLAGLMMVGAGLGAPRLDDLADHADLRKCCSTLDGTPHQDWCIGHE